MKKRICISVFISCCLAVQIFLLTGSVFHDSLVYDEITYTKAGYEFLSHHDFRADPFNPPFARELIALPLLINKNVVNDTILLFPRMIVVIFSLLLTTLIYFFSKYLFGEKAAFFSLVLSIFEPNLLAQGHVATIDLIFTFFFTLSVYLFVIWFSSFSWRRVVLFSVVLGLTVSTKISSLGFLFPTLLALYIYKEKKRSMLLFKRSIKKIFGSFIVFLLSLWSTYFFTFEPLLGYRYDTQRPAIALAKHNFLISIALTLPIPLGSFISTVKQIIIFSYSPLYIKNSFLLGKVVNDGMLGLFFPILIFLKTPLPLITLFLCALFYGIRKNKSIILPLIPILVILFIVSFTKIPLVLRYILPIYPFIIITASSVIVLKMPKFLKIFGLLILLLWYVYGTLHVSPNYISYINELVDGSENGYKYIADANLDWGQGLIALKAFQGTHSKKPLQLAFFGGGYSPSKYGITYTRIRDASLNDTKEIEPFVWSKKGIVAISVTCWYLCHYNENAHLKNLKPKEIVGGSILIFYE